MAHIRITSSLYDIGRRSAKSEAPAPFSGTQHSGTIRLSISNPPYPVRHFHKGPARRGGCGDIRAFSDFVADSFRGRLCPSYRFWSYPVAAPEGYTVCHNASIFTLGSADPEHMQVKESNIFFLSYIPYYPSSFNELVYIYFVIIFLYY